MARGDRELLRTMYPAIKKYLKAVKFWASLSGPGKYRRYIWKWLFQFGDWCAPEGGIFDWMKRGREIATAYYANSCRIVSEIARILGKSEDAEYYALLSQKIAASFRHVFTDGMGTLKKEFQTGYVLPLAFGLAEGAEREVMAQNLDRLVREREYHLSTGFTLRARRTFSLPLRMAERRKRHTSSYCRIPHLRGLPASKRTPRQPGRSGRSIPKKRATSLHTITMLMARWATFCIAE